MATDIYKELSEISKNRYGVDIRFPIHDALAILSNEEYELIGEAINGQPINHIDLSSADITNELEIIESGTKGADVKQAIHDALYKIWQLKVSPIQVVSGLVGIDLTGISRPQPSPNYTEGLQDDFENIYDFMSDSGLFSDIIYDDLANEKRITVYENDKAIAAIHRFRAEDYSYGYQILVYSYNDDGTRKGTLAYPSSLEDPETYNLLSPYSGMRTENALLLSCSNDAICFSKNSADGISVSFGGGYETYSGSIFPASRIRTFNYNSTISENGGIGKSYPISDTAALTPLIAEGTEAHSIGAYAITVGGGSGWDQDGVVNFGSRKLYIANFILAIEI